MKHHCWKTVGPLWILIFFVCGLGLPEFSDARQGRDDTPVSADDVRQSIKRAVQFLKGRQNNNGSWREFQYPGDTTALCTLALLNAETDPNDPAIQRGLDYIVAIPRDAKLKNYVVSLRIMAFVAADPEGENTAARSQPM